MKGQMYEMIRIGGFKKSSTHNTLRKNPGHG